MEYEQVLGALQFMIEEAETQLTEHKMAHIDPTVSYCIGLLKSANTVCQLAVGRTQVNYLDNNKRSVENMTIGELQQKQLEMQAKYGESSDSFPAQTYKQPCGDA